MNGISYTIRVVILLFVISAFTQLRCVNYVSAESLIIRKYSTSDTTVESLCIYDNVHIMLLLITSIMMIIMDSISNVSTVESDINVSSTKHRKIAKYECEYYNTLFASRYSLQRYQKTVD